LKGGGAKICCTNWIAEGVMSERAGGNMEICIWGEVIKKGAKANLMLKGPIVEQAKGQRVLGSAGCLVKGKRGLEADGPAQKPRLPV